MSFSTLQISVMIFSLTACKLEFSFWSSGVGEIASTSGTYDWLLDGGVETTAGWILGDGLDDGPGADPASLGSV